MSAIRQQQPYSIEGHSVVFSHYAGRMFTISTVNEEYINTIQKVIQFDQVPALICQRQSMKNLHT